MSYHIIYELWEYRSTVHISEFLIPVVCTQLPVHIIPVSFVICVSVTCTVVILVSAAWQKCYRFFGGRKAFLKVDH